MDKHTYLWNRIVFFQLSVKGAEEDYVDFGLKKLREIVSQICFLGEGLPWRMIIHSVEEKSSIP